jgi:hypothetical protein
MDLKKIFQKTEVQTVQLQWQRNSEGKLFLWVNEDGNWVLFNKSKHYTPDVRLSTNSGFATAQAYLKLSASKVINLEYLPSKD